MDWLGRLVVYARKNPGVEVEALINGEEDASFTEGKPDIDINIADKLLKDLKHYRVYLLT